METKDRDTIFFTIVDPDNGKENRVYINFNTALRHEPTRIEFPKEVVSIDPQQLAELGYLLVALSKGDFDSDSVTELIDGYGYDTLVSPL